MIIRNLFQQELADLAQIDKAVNLTPWSLKSYGESFANPKHNILGIFTAKNKLFGGCVYCIVLDECEILQLIVAAEFQSQGYASRILEHVFSELKAKFVKEIFLEVMVDNIPAIQLYQKNGFNIISKRKDYYLINKQRFDALLMGKTLCL